MRRTANLVLMVLGLALGATVLYLPKLREVATVGAGFVAKEVCSCLYVGERDFQSCRTDVRADMDLIRAEVLPSDDGVRAWLPLLTERVARHHPGSGCTLY